MNTMSSADAPLIFTPEYYRRMRELESGSWWNAGMREVAAAMLTDAGLPPAGLMLDVGCGSGQTMRWFTRLRPGWQAIGLDVAAEGLAAARAMGIHGVTRASALELPVRSASADVIVTLDVLQHLPLDGGDRRALREIVRVLKPGGCVLIRTNAQAYPFTPDDPAFDFHKYRVPELRARLEEAGLDVLRIGRLNALLGLAEIPRELRARSQPNAYHGILSEPRPGAPWIAALKRAWLRLEGGALRRGMTLPMGRTILALARRRS